LRRKSVVILILVDVVNGDVKAGRVGDVENVEAKFKDARSVSLVVLTKEMSRRFCHDCRKILRCPVVAGTTQARDLCCLTMCYFDET
jgi:RNase P subunit RPR2